MNFFKKLLAFFNFSQTEDFQFDENGVSYFVSYVIDRKAKRVRLLAYEAWKAAPQGIEELENTSELEKTVLAHLKAMEETIFGADR